MTREEFDEIRTAMQQVRIYRDTFGGEFVKQGDARIYGARAIMHRRRLIQWIDQIGEKLRAMENPPEIFSDQRREKLG